MLNLLQRIGNAFLSLLDLVLPIFEQARTSRRLATGVRLVLGILLIVVIVILLYWLDHRYFKLERFISVKGEWRFLASSWLPLLFLLIVAFCWLSWWLWKLLFADEPSRGFEDIDRAWDQAMNTLEEQGVRLADLPLFLVLGTPEDAERALFQAAQVKVELEAPDTREAPLRVYATQDALYVTCVGASALGYHALFLAGKGAAVGGDGGGQRAEEEDVLATLSPGSARKMDSGRAVGKMAEVLKRAEREGRGLLFTKAEKRELRALYREDNPHRSPLKQPALIDEQVARLEHLCQLIIRDRHPYCPVNGILVLVPFAGTDSDSDASDTGVVCQRDLTIAVQTLRTHCPVIALVCDLETAPGFPEFVQGFKQRERLARLGHGSPLMPLLRSQQRSGGTESMPPEARMVHSLAAWVCESVVRSWVYHAFQIERGGEDVHSLATSNARIFLFFDEVQQRGKRLGHILASIMASRNPDRPLFGGCYLAGTGTSPEQEQGFVRGVLIQRMLAGENCVYWTDDALADEAALRRYTTIGWTILVLLVAAVAALVAFAWTREG